MALDERQRRHWRDEGFIVIPGFFSPEEVGAITDSLETTWREKPQDVTVDDLVTAERKRASQVSDHDASAHSFKVNDLYLKYETVRNVALSARVGTIVGELLEDAPVLCNTLNLEKGSQQADHLDTLYMTPATPGKLVATWMALEDVHGDAGPLRYYPGSQHIPTYLFSDGGMHTVPEEMDRWSEYMAEGVGKRGLEEQTFLAAKGDLFLWHAGLLHGGSDIIDTTLTRNSLVTHFWAEADCGPFDLQDAPGGKWMRRPPQPVPSEGPPRSEIEERLAAQAADERAVTAVRDGVAVHPRRSLVERMKQLVLNRD